MECTDLGSGKRVEGASGGQDPKVGLVNVSVEPLSVGLSGILGGSFVNDLFFPVLLQAKLPNEGDLGRDATLKRPLYCSF